MTISDDVVYRVIKLPATLRTAMQQARDASEQTNAQFLTSVVDAQLPTLVSQLEQLGFGHDPGPAQHARLPFSETAGTWADLRDASDKLQIPATRLLQVCIASAIGGRRASSRRRRGTASPSTASSTKRKKGTSRRRKGRRRKNRTS